uniref:Peptidase S8/S53 domain-containing protein n=1 Tax=Tetradesmus obliquus TaxID=3088 RepID=A0A383VNZ6_TETOB|eukprot:jgi/Sobl393_1/5639/SZX67245.1
MLHQHQATSRLIKRAASELAAGHHRVLAATVSASAQQGVVDGQVIVKFKPTAGPAAFAGKRLITLIYDPSAGAAIAAAGESQLSWSVIGPNADQSVCARDSSPAAAESDVAAQQASSSSSGVQAIVIRGISESQIAIIQQSGDVEVVIPELSVQVPDGMAPATMDLMSISAARRCANAPEINSGVAAKSVPMASLGWPTALAACSTGTYAVFVAQRCGNNFNLLEYKAIYAVNTATKQVKKVKGRECSLFPQQLDKAKWFGSCGVAPRAVSDMPTMFCNSFPNCAGGIIARTPPAGAAVAAESAAAPAAADAASSTEAAAAAAAAADPTRFTARVTLKRPLKCGDGSTTTLVLTGSACGPNRAFVQWTRAQAPGCSFVRDNSRTGFKSTLALLGSCGAGPAVSDKIVPSDVCPGEPPKPPKPSPKPPTNPISGWAPLARMPVAAGEDVPRGVAMVEAVTDGGACAGAKCVDDLSDAAPSRRLIVAVADSGVDETHPDLSYVGGTSWLDAGEDQPGIDGFGHGTHVAGIIGAKNTGKGVVGVSPGIGIYSLKILDSYGNGVLSDAMRAIKWVIAEGPSKGIKVINFSLAGHVDPSKPYYQPMVDLFCGVCKEASDAGITIVAAAGNDNRNIAEYIPAVCPTVMTVTALDQDGARGASWSNYADASNAAAKAHTFAGPGTAIVSTVPRSIMDAGYLELGGTSMASPHVAGIAANCIMSGRCNGTGADAMAKIQEAAQSRLNMVKGPDGTPWVTYTPTPVAGGKYYGYLVWSQF